MTTHPTITAPAREWLRVLAVAASGSSRRPPLPILHGVLLTHRGGSITAQTYDYDTAATTTLDGAVTSGLAEEQQVVASRRWLYEAIKSTTGRHRAAPVELTIEGEKLTVRSCGYELTSEAMPAADYPTPHAAHEPQLTLPTKLFAEVVRRVGAAVSPDETLPILNGIQFQFGREAIRLFATDRYRLTTEVIPCESAFTGNVVLQAKRLTSLLSKLDGETVDIGVGEGHVTFISGRNTFTTTAVDGDYPKLAPLFPEAAELAIEADRITLIESTRVAISLAPRNVPCILRVDADGAAVTFSDGLFEESKAPKAAGAIVTGSAPTVGAFNPAYLLDALQSVSTERVRISMNAPTKPWVFTLEGVDVSASDTYRYLLMPVRLPQN